MDERLRELQRRWSATGDPLDLSAWDQETRRAGYLGPIAADAINRCLQLATTVVVANPYPTFAELTQDWEDSPNVDGIAQAKFPIFTDGRPLVQDPARVDLIVRSLLLDEPPVVWSDTWERNRDGYPLWYEFAHVLNDLLHAIKHGLRYNSEELDTISKALKSISAGDTLLCNMSHWHRLRGHRMHPCTLPILECNTNDCRCYYGDTALNVCEACGYQQTACVCEQFHEWEVGNTFGGPVVLLIHPMAELCACHGSGWAVTNLDSIHQCPHHYSGQLHPEDVGIGQSLIEDTSSTPPPPSPEDDLPF